MKKETVKNFIIYSLPNIVLMLLPLLTMPITTKYLTKEAFGILASVSIIYSIHAIFSEIGIGYSINADWYKTDSQGKLLFNLFLLSFVFTLSAIVILYLLQHFVYGYILGEIWNDIRHLYYFVMLRVLVIPILVVFKSWVIIDKHPKLSSILKISEIIISALTVILVVIFTKSWQIIIISKIFIGIIFAFISFYFISKKMIFIFSEKIIKDAIHTGYPIFFRSIFNFTRKQFDKIYVLNLFGAGEFALYNFSGRFNNILVPLKNNYTKSYMSLLYESLSKNKLDIMAFRKTLYLLFYMTFSFSVFIVLFGEILIELWTNSLFSDAYPYVIIYMCIGVSLTIFSGSEDYLFYFKQSKKIFFNTVIQAIITILGCLLLIPKIGVIGALISLWIGNFIYFFLAFVYKQKKLKQYFIEKITIIYVIVFHLMVISIVLNPNIKLYAFVILFFTWIASTIHIYIYEKETIKKIIKKCKKLI